MNTAVNTQPPAIGRRDLTPHIGSELTVDTAALVRGDHADALRHLLEARGVLAFRDLPLTDEQQVEFTRTLVSGDQDFQVTRITMDPLENPRAEYIKGAFFWHIDGTMIDAPIYASVMRPHRLSSSGGQTEFCNTYAAYETLPDTERAALEDLQVVHMFETAQRHVNPEPSYEELCRWQEYAPRTLPLVWTHRSGRKSLVLGSTASHIEGMSLREGWALLTRLRDWATRPEFVYRHQWELGDLVIWDNTGTMHRAIPYDPDSGRLMYRTQIAGDEPIV